jgi:hypothetical protein
VTPGLDDTWRVAVGARFVLILTDFTDKVKAIRGSRALSSMGLGDAKDFVERAPSRFPLRLTLEEACGVSKYFSGGRIRIDSQCRGSDPAVSVVFDVSVALEPKVWDPASFPLPPESVRAFLDFLVAIDHVTQAKAARMRRADPQTLATSFELHRLEERLREWRAILSPADATQSWVIEFYISFRALQES